MTSVSLSARNVIKRYGGVVALSDGNLEVQSGEVVALLGANGSGKSTLTKVITGVIAPNEGQLHLDDQPIRFSSPQVAKRMGIAAVYQELSLIPDMTVAENIWLTHEPRRFGLRVDFNEMQARTKDLLALFAGTTQTTLEPDEFVSALPPDERQVVEILKAYSQQPRLMILDEATASLDSQQVGRLFELITDWKQQGMAIVFVSHRMDEIFRVADRATVLRNGASVGDRVIDETTEQELVELMIEGVGTPQIFSGAMLDPAAPIRLAVENLQTDILQGVSFDLRDGELLGLGGLQGQGQADLLLALFGAIPFTGKVELSGQDVHFKHPRQAMQQDVAFVPGDRGSEGVLLIRSILENLHLPSWSKYGFPLKMDRARADANQVVDDLSIVLDTLDSPVSSLSGGNAQKVVIGKWLLRDPRLLLLNDPTKGVDVGAKAEFYVLLNTLREAGTTIIFYSSDDEELLGLCNRVLVLQDGSVRAELAGADLTQSNLVAASMGTVQASNGVSELRHE
ncbi:sugar ABC transporter ATP-binding protein [Chloroflexota bacterium]